MNETVSTKISDDYSPGYYEEGYDDDPYSSGTIAGVGKMTSLIEGDLADRVRARTGRSGEVTIIEDHWDIGYCVTCSDEMIDFEVQVGGEKVFRTEYADGGSEELGALSITAYREFNDWLNGADA